MPATYPLEIIGASNIILSYENLTVKMLANSPVFHISGNKVVRKFPEQLGYEYTVDLPVDTSTQDTQYFLITYHPNDGSEDSDTLKATSVTQDDLNSITGLSPFSIIPVFDSTTGEFIVSVAVVDYDADNNTYVISSLVTSLQDYTSNGDHLIPFADNSVINDDGIAIRAVSGSIVEPAVNILGSVYGLISGYFYGGANIDVEYLMSSSYCDVYKANWGSWSKEELFDITDIPETVSADTFYDNGSEVSIPTDSDGNIDFGTADHSKYYELTISNTYNSYDLSITIGYIPYIPADLSREIILLEVNYTDLDGNSQSLKFTYDNSTSSIKLNGTSINFIPVYIRDNSALTISYRLTGSGFAVIINGNEVANVNNSLLGDNLDYYTSVVVGNSKTDTSTSYLGKITRISIGDTEVNSRLNEFIHITNSGINFAGKWGTYFRNSLFKNIGSSVFEFGAPSGGVVAY